MNTYIAKLYTLSKKSNRLIIGLMSGTSLDGLDIALCRIHNSGKETKLDLVHFETFTYSASFRSRLRQVFAQRNVDQQILSGLHVQIAKTHAQFVNTALAKWQIAPEAIDLIASHGQTVFHAPQSLTKNKDFPDSTFQIGDGDHIAVDTGIITISDFRQKHVAAGGEGAPLAVYGDYLLFSDEIENRILVNIGGISNFTFLPNKNSKLKSFATDIGPGNTIMNQYMLKYFDKEMDFDGSTAETGNVHPPLLDGLLDSSFIKLPFPKTTGPELFNLDYLEEKLQKIDVSLSHQDTMATLNAFTARCITLAIQNIATNVEDITLYISGGGIHNPILWDNIKKDLGSIKMKSFADLGLNPDAKEACLFALLANEAVSGSPKSVSVIENAPAVCMGKISLPE